MKRQKQRPNRLRSQDGEEEDYESDEVPRIPIADDGMPMSPDAVSRARLAKRFPNEEIDVKHLYTVSFFISSEKRTFCIAHFVT